jgi:hypothetical protein
MRRNLSIIVLLAAVLFAVACSEAPKPEPVEAINATSEAAGPVSGKTAYWAMYKSAYMWSNDAVPLKLESKAISGIKSEAGTAGLWSATFGSPQKREALEISYAVVAQLPDVAKGVNVGHGVPWSGSTRDVMPFQGSDIVVDSDAAYKSAATQAQSWLKTHPDKEARFLLGNNATKFPTPVWYVTWGDKRDGYGAFVNTKTGEIAKQMK